MLSSKAQYDLNLFESLLMLNIAVVDQNILITVTFDLISIAIDVIEL